MKEQRLDQLDGAIIDAIRKNVNRIAKQNESYVRQDEAIFIDDPSFKNQDIATEMEGYTCECPACECQFVLDHYMDIMVCPVCNAEIEPTYLEDYDADGSTQDAYDNTFSDSNAMPNIDQDSDGLYVKIGESYYPYTESYAVEDDEAEKMDEAIRVIKKGVHFHNGQKEVISSNQRHMVDPARSRAAKLRYNKIKNKLHGAGAQRARRISLKKFHAAN